MANKRAHSESDSNDSTTKKPRITALAVRKDILDFSGVPPPPSLSMVVMDPIQDDVVESGDESQICIPKREDEFKFSLNNFKHAVGVQISDTNDYNGPMPLDPSSVEPVTFANQAVRTRRSPFQHNSLQLESIDHSDPVHIGWLDLAGVPEPFRSSWTAVENLPREVAKVHSLPLSSFPWRHYTKEVSISQNKKVKTEKISSEGDILHISAVTRPQNEWRHSALLFRPKKSSRKDPSTPLKGKFALLPVKNLDIEVQRSFLKTLIHHKSGLGFTEATSYFNIHKLIHRAKLANVYTRAARSIPQIPSRSIAQIGGDNLTTNQSIQKQSDLQALVPRARVLANQFSQVQDWFLLSSYVPNDRMTQQQEERDELDEAARLGRLEKNRRVQLRNEILGLPQGGKSFNTDKKAFMETGRVAAVSTLEDKQVDAMRKVYPPFNDRTENVNEVFDILAVFNNVITAPACMNDLDEYGQRLFEITKSNRLSNISSVEEIGALAKDLDVCLLCVHLAKESSAPLLSVINSTKPYSTSYNEANERLLENNRLIVMLNFMIRLYRAFSRKSFYKKNAFIATSKNVAGVSESVSEWLFANFYCLDQRTGVKMGTRDFLNAYPATFDNGFTKSKWLLHMLAIALHLSPTKSLSLSLMRTDFACAKMDDIAKLIAPWLAMLGCKKNDTGSMLTYQQCAPLSVPLAEGTVRNQMERKKKMTGKK